MVMAGTIDGEICFSLFCQTPLQAGSTAFMRFVNVACIKILIIIAQRKGFLHSTYVKKIKKVSTVF